jgi:hypothetical protein
MRKQYALTLLAIAGSVVAAQDSTGTAPGLPGDAINPLDAAQQILPYVADLTPFGTSWGTTFGIVPLVKGVKGDPAFFNGFIGANGISDDLLQDVGYASSGYALWTEAPGVGVNPTANSNAYMTVTPTGTSSQFAVGMANAFVSGAFGGDTITTALVNYNPSEPNRLYVTRIEAASSINAAGTGVSGDLAFGSVDANGNTYYRGGSFNAGGAIAPQVSNNWYRSRAQDRAAVVNEISGAGGSDATDHLVVATTTPHPAPSNIPASVSSGNGLVAGANFNGQFARGAAAPLIADSTHFGMESTLGYTPGDQRGHIGTTTRNLFNSGVAHTAVAAKDQASDTRTLNVWATDASGTVSEAHSFETPLTVVDPTDGRTVNYIAGSSEYRQYAGVVGFRSGGGMVALGQDNAGNNYAGAVMSQFGVSFDLAMQSLAVRFDDNGQNPEWSIIGWTDPAGIGKDILDGPGGAPIGMLVPFRTAFPAANVRGPAMSTPTFDGAGNAWFLASAALNKIDMDTGDPFIDYDTVLIRGVLTEQSGGGFGYELELVLELGRTFYGQNSGDRWQIQFVDMVAASGDNGLGVAAPASIDHNNGRSWGWDDSDLSGVDNADPITNGGIVMTADIVYDINGDGEYNDPSGTGDPLSPDQSYQALLYIGYYADGPQPCNAADLAEPFGILDLSDINAFVAGFLGMDPIADIDNSGIFDLADINAFVAAFTAGCP